MKLKSASERGLVALDRYILLYTQLFQSLLNLYRDQKQSQNFVCFFATGLRNRLESCRQENGRGCGREENIRCLSESNRCSGIV